jgi:hypothetical protein
MCESSAAMPLPTDFDLPTEGYLLPSHGLALPECSWLPGHKDSLHACVTPAHMVRPCRLKCYEHKRCLPGP